MARNGNQGSSQVLLTDLAVRSLKPGEWASDRAARGAGRLQARKLSSGETAWYYRYTLPSGKRDTLPLGSGLDLKSARARAAELSRRYQAGERDLREALDAEQREARRERDVAAQAAAAQAVHAQGTLGVLLLA
ncbi:Arm DNA-binding domain-containing protein, partial [Staphylococcus aureus]|uniref:Arm DNA-binding domain-containing protein n=1 Tax=Staphylococcus aureus TaxID=1280 RepID=UPI0039BE7FBC